MKGETMHSLIQKSLMKKHMATHKEIFNDLFGINALVIETDLNNYVKRDLTLEMYDDLNIELENELEL